MQLHSRRLTVNMHGADVRLLHARLQALGLDIPDAEVQKNIFGTGTQEAVGRFQQQQGIRNVTGVVDGATAKLISTQMRERRLEIDEQVLQLVNIDTELIDQTSKLSGIDSKLNTQNSRLRTIDTKLGLHTTELGGINSKLGTHGTHLGKINTELGDQTTKLSVIDAKLGTHTNRLGNIDSKLGAHATELGGINNKLSVHTTTLGNLDTKFSDNLTKLGHIDTELGTQTTQLTGIDTKLGAHTGHLGNIDSKLGLHTASLGSIDAKIGEQTGALGNIDGKLGAHTTKLGEQTARLGSIDAKLSVLGEVIAPAASIAPNARGTGVHALHVNLGKLGFNVPQYEIDERVFGVGTQDILRRIQTKYQLAATGVFDDATKGAIAIAVGGAETPQSTVEGRVLLDNGEPARGVTVEVYSRRFGNQNRERLGEVDGNGHVIEIKTDDQGFYATRYQPHDDIANLDVLVLDDQGREVSRSATKYTAAKHDVLNVIAPANIQVLNPEYQRLTEALTPHIGPMSELAGAKENDERQDLTLLNRATGWDARLVALAATTERLRGDADLEFSQQALYGLLRAGLPSEKRLLAQIEPDVAEQALRTVRDAGIVALDDPEMNAFQQQFRAFANKVRLAVPAPGSRSTYDELLKTSGLSEDVQQTFAPIYLSHRGDAGELWEKARAQGLEDAEIGTLQRQGKLAFLAGNSAAMTGRLMQMIPDDPAQLVDQDFYQAESWVNELYAAAGVPDNERDNPTPAQRLALEAIIPEAYAGDQIEARIDAYSEDMARKVRLSYPTEVVGRMIEQDDADTFNLGVTRDGTATLLKHAAGQGFRLGETPVPVFLQAHKGVAASMAADEFDAAQQQLQTLQRVYQITPSNEAMPVLMGMNMTSAYDVMGYTEAAFEQRYCAKYEALYGKKPKRTETRLIYRKAKQVSSMAYNLFTVAKQVDSQAPFFGVSASVEARESARQEMIKQFPTLESLFGSIDFCECEHCRSVLSPAAYLVDLLQFVDAEDEVWANFLANWEETRGEPYSPTYEKPYDALVRRRPDLPHIPLTCENTHTALPYIDIVNEVLEYYIAHGRLEEEAAQDTGDVTTAELLAEPQNVIREAYNKLHEARYPVQLPFDLWIDTVRQFCAYFETPLARLLDVMRPGDALFAPTEPVDRASVFMESLGLSPAEASIFTDPEPLGLGKWHDLYGYPRAEIGSPSNVGQATVTIPNAQAERFSVADQCRYYQALTGALRDEAMAVAAIGPKDSGGLGRVVLTFVGIWTSPPSAGDILVLANVPDWLKSARTLSRRLGVTYREVVEIVKTGFVNPELEQLGLLDKLSVGISDARFYLEHRALLPLDATTLSPEEQERRLEVEAFSQRLDRLANQLEVSRASLDADIQAMPFDRILVLADPDAGCNFDLTTLRYANEDPADDIAFLRMNLFVRLWRQLGWPIEETDRALQGFVPKTAPVETAHLDKQPLRTALIYLAHLKALDDRLHLGKQSRLKLMALWSDMTTTGPSSLYAQLFLTSSGLDPVFDEPLGRYLSAGRVAHFAQSRQHRVALQNVSPADAIDPAPFAAEPKIELFYDALQEVQHLAFEGELSDAEKGALTAHSPSPALPVLLDAVQVRAQEFSTLKGHLLTLQGRLNLTADEIGHILEDAGMSLDTGALSIPNISLLYRYGMLAKALKLSVPELIALKQLSGLDPFKPLHPDPLMQLEDDHPFSQTLRFVEVVEAVEASGLQVDDLAYWLRHRFDETGPYRPNREDTLALLKTLAEGIHAIRLEHAVPEDPGAMSDEVLRQKLGLALPADVVERFLAMMNGTVEFTATKTGVAQVDELQPALFVHEQRIRQVRYQQEPYKAQKLTLRGVLFDAQKTQLETAFDASLSDGQKTVFAELLSEVQAKALAFFEKHLQKQAAERPPATGFLDAEDFGLLFDQDLALGAGETEQDRTRKQRAKLANAFLPFLQARLTRAFIIQTITASTTADPALVESLITDARLLAKPGPLLDVFAATGKRGVNASFFNADNGSGERQATQESVFSVDTALKDERDANGNPLNPANSARFEGYLEVPAAGVYRFFVAFEKENAEAELRFEHLPKPLLLKGAADADGDEIGGEDHEYLELQPGLLYPFTLNLHKLSGGAARLLVQSETVPKDGLFQLALYPKTNIERGERALLLLTKTLQLLERLGLSERETRYFAESAAFGGLRFSTLPTAADEDTSDGAQTLFAHVLRLAAYVRLKRDLADGTDDLIEIFEVNGETGVDAVYPLLAKLTRREESTVKACANALFDAPDFASEQPLWKWWEGLQVVERFGVPVASLLAWTGIINPALPPAQRYEIARGLKEAIKARFEPEDWQRVAQPIFDKLRQRQRDALVAYVMHQHGFDRIEQLYEYFLIDPGMEPVVQTSRIRLAIASLQLFIQRCLLNLEQTVHPSVLSAKQWEWMKRYRVWEANRKIFLFPENWLEPEFRDDKTHLFDELEGALLQGDVSSDLVEDAFFSYLKKLDELARLDIAAMHFEDDPDPALRTLHVIGRTYSHPHKYFYRRYAHQMWTPWEPVSAEVEGDHLVPVVWRDRLYLFWVTFIDKAPAHPAPASALGNLLISEGQKDHAVIAMAASDPIGSTKLIDLSLSSAISGMQAVIADKMIDVELHWSEYFQGEWSTRESSGLEVLRDITVSRNFDPKSVFVHVSKAMDGDEERGVYIQLAGKVKQAFFLAGRNSAPEAAKYEDGDPVPANVYVGADQVRANRYGGNHALAVKVTTRMTTESDTRLDVETPGILYQGDQYTLLPCDNNLKALGVSREAYRDAADPGAVEDAIERGLGEIASLMRPIFYQDNAHTLFVEPEVVEQTIEEWQTWVTRTPQPESTLNKDWLDELDVIAEIPRRGPIPDPEGPWPIPGGPDPYINPKVIFDWLANPTTALLFDDVLIGPAGRAGAEVLPVDADRGAAESGTFINVNPGSGLAPDSSVILTGSALEQDGLIQGPGGLNVVGRGGFNSAMSQNVKTMNRFGPAAGMSGVDRIGR